MAILTQFVLRLSFGLALAMAVTDPRQVTSGYYRNHLYVLLGLTVLATMVALGAPGQFAVAPPLVAAVLCYLGSVLWLYEKPRPGIIVLFLIAAVTLWGSWADSNLSGDGGAGATLLAWLEAPTAGLVLGFTIGAMFLGHWYLNSPTMALGPLRRLIGLMAAAILLRAAVEAAGLAQGVASAWPTTNEWLFVALRWLSGIVGALALAVMAWQTLKIPNTQSATGILYVAVIVTFLGELIALLIAQRQVSPPVMGEPSTVLVVPADQVAARLNSAVRVPLIVQVGWPAAGGGSFLVPVEQPKMDLTPRI